MSRLSLRSPAAWTCVVLLFLLSCQSNRQQAPGAPPATPVTVVKARRQSLPIQISVVGSVEASEVVQVKSRVGGQLTQVHFREGQNIARNAPLFQIDPQPYQEALRQAEARVVQDRALLKQAEATLARDQAQSQYSELDAERSAKLSKEGIIAQSTADQLRSKAQVDQEAARASQAAIESARALLQSNLAAVDRAKLDLSYCQITAPIAGRAGNLLVNAGNLVEANQTALVVLNKTAPAFVTFSVPEQHLAVIRRLQARNALTVRASPKDEPVKTSTGRLTVIDNTVDAATGSIRLKAVFENGDGMLWPGQFVNVVLTLEAHAEAVVVPGVAVQAGQDGSFVYVVKGDNTVEFRPVVAGRTVGDRTVIDKGVNDGETVVTDGHLRLAPGAAIEVVDPSKLGSNPEKP